MEEHVQIEGLYPYLPGSNTELHGSRGCRRISLPAVLACTRHDTCCLQCTSCQSPALPGTAAAAQKTGALVRLQPCQRNLDNHCHQVFRSNALIPLLSPSSAPPGSQQTHSYPLAERNRRGFRRDSTMFCAHFADTWPHGRPQRKRCCWLPGGGGH